MSDITQSKQEMSPQINEIAEALSKAQSELGSATKDQSGYGYNYSDLSSVINSSKSVLSKNGLSVVQLLGASNSDTVDITTILAHKSGQFFKTTTTIPIIDMKGCNAAQNMGASISYGRRYAYQSIIGQASEDNDASSEGFKKSSTPSIPTKAAATKADTKVETKAQEETKVEEKAPAANAPKRGGFKTKTLGASNANSEL